MNKRLNVRSAEIPLTLTTLALKLYFHGQFTLSWLTPTASVTTGEIQPFSSWSSLNFASTHISAVDW